MHRETFIGIVRAVEITNLARAEINDAREILAPVLVFPCGLNYNPPPGSRVVGLAIDGDRANTYGIAYNTQNTIQPMQSGDVALNTPFDETQLEIGTHRIHLYAQDGSITIVAGDSKITLEQDGSVRVSGNIVLDGDVKVEGKLSATGVIESDTEISANGVDLSTHQHIIMGGSSAGTTSPPTKTA